MRRILAYFCIAVLLCGCSAGEKTDIGAFAPSGEMRLNVLAALDGSCWESVAKEFQSRTGIWVRMASEASAGDDGWDICLTLGAGSEENTVCRSPLVVIYNPKLVRMQIPTGWESLLDSVWQGQIAFADPDADVTSALALALMHSLLGEEGIEAFSVNVPVLLADQQAVIEAVADGSSCLGIVTESAALIAQSRNYSLSVLYPREGTCAAEVTAQLRERGVHRENAGAFLDFLLGDDAQSYLQTNGCCRPREDTMADVPGELFREPDMSCWQSVWESTREAGI